mgnify:CR=1 FL=1
MVSVWQFTNVNYCFTPSNYYVTDEKLQFTGIINDLQVEWNFVNIDIKCCKCYEHQS